MLPDLGGRCCDLERCDHSISVGSLQAATLNILKKLTTLVRFSFFSIWPAGCLMSVLVFPAVWKEEKIENNDKVITAIK